MSQVYTKGRQKEANLIRKANRAVVVGMLLQGKLSNWREFLEADNVDYENLPRQQLKAGLADVKTRVSKECKNFCSRNFKNLDEEKLNDLYEEIKAHRGIEIPLNRFEKEYSEILPKALNNCPLHSTVVISLWGLQFKFPEDNLSKDLHVSLSLALDAGVKLSPFKNKAHHHITKEKDQISRELRAQGLAVRSTMICCFNLVEAYLNGLAWEYTQKSNQFETLSNTNRKLICDANRTSIRDKLLKYPTIIANNALWTDNDDDVRSFLDTIKPLRDSLVHPSPFSAPEKFGGYDKLANFYRVDIVMAIAATKVTCSLISRIHRHINNTFDGHPTWLKELIETTDRHGSFTDS